MYYKNVTLINITNNTSSNPSFSLYFVYVTQNRKTPIYEKTHMLIK